MLESIPLQELLSPFSFVLKTEYRVFWGYLIASGLLTVWVMHRQNKPIVPGIRFLFSSKLWRNPSVLLDFKLIFLNNFTWVLLAAPYFGGQTKIAGSVAYSLKTALGSGGFISGSTLSLSIMFTLLVFIVDDFSRFFVHRAYHKIPILWRFHAVHHSSTLMTPFTVYRIHCIEMLINAARSMIVFGTMGGLFIYFTSGQFTKLEVLGTSIFSLAFNFAGANLRHSHIWLGFGKCEHWVMSPAQHQIHHSAAPEHFDKNFGVMIPLWDKLFNSWVSSANTQVGEIGLGHPVKQSIAGTLFGIKPQTPDAFDAGDTAPSSGHSASSSADQLD